MQFAPFLFIIVNELSSLCFISTFYEAHKTLTAASSSECLTNKCVNMLIAVKI
jgi:hypothetical protein